MLLQEHASHLRLISQHQHALLCGAIAHVWASLDNLSAPYSTFDTLLAITFHDHPWHTFDLRATFNPQTAQPHHFLSVPIHVRLQLYSDGLDFLETTHPLSALLVSLHYTTLRGTRSHLHFQQNERLRRARISALYDVPHVQEELAKPLSLLRFLDLLSLFACLTPPPIGGESAPPWLLPNGRGTLPSGGPIQVIWESPDHLTLDPFPLKSPLSIPVVVRDLPQTTFQGQEELDSVWDQAPDKVWNLRLSGPEQSA